MATKKIKKEYPRMSFEKHLKKMRSTFETFTTSMTSRTASIEIDNTKMFFADKSFSKRTFPIFKILERDILASGILPPTFGPEHISYYRFSPRILGYLPVAYGYDINSAYLQSLKNVGYITNDTFNLISKMSKKDRLAVVGMLATSKIITTFEKGNVVSSTIEENQTLRHVFFHISKLVGDCLLDFFNQYDGLFFWVDGIICKTKCDTALFKRHGFDIKQEYITDLVCERKKRSIVITYDKHEGSKTFNIKKKIFLNKNTAII